MSNPTNPQVPVPHLYGSLCSLYYDLKEGFAPSQEVDFYARFIHPEQLALEAMSGSGRVQIPLLQRGLRVEGVDSSPDMLERCKQRCAQFHLSPNLYQQNIEQLALPTLYHTIFIALGSFQLIADYDTALGALQRLHAHMQPGGTLLLDIFTPDRALHGHQSTDTIILDSRYALRFTAHYIFDAHEQRVRVACLYELLDCQTQQAPARIIKQERETMNFIWYTDQEWMLLLEKAGFKTIAFHEERFRSAGPSRIIEAQAR